MTSVKRKKSPMKWIWMGSAVFAVLVMVGGFFLLKVLLSDDERKRKKRVHQVTLLKPPPPPKIKEKPPEPEIKKKEEIIEKIEEPKPEDAPEDAQDDTPPGDELGLDADGTGGSDGFGLKAKKGGRALIGGNVGRSSLLRRYAWYNQIVEKEIRSEVDRLLEKNGGVPKGRHKTIIEIFLDDLGNIVKYGLKGSSGHQRIDKAVQEALRSLKISEPPPQGMPRGIKIAITSKG